MNVILKSDLYKFLSLLKVGIKNANHKEIKIYHTDGGVYDEISTTKECYVKLELSYTVDKDKMDETILRDDFDFENQIDELLNIKP